MLARSVQAACGRAAVAMTSAGASAVPALSSISSSASCTGSMWVTPSSLPAATCSRAALVSWSSARGVSAPVPRRHFMDFFKNMKDNVIKGRQDKALEKRKELVAWQLTQLKTLPSYGMKQHVDTLKTMMDKATEGVVTQAVLAVTEAVSAERKAEIDEQKIGIRIGEALTAEEIADPSLVRAREKLRIATAVGCDVAKVTQFMQAFEMSRTMHGWLQERKKRGLPLPEGIDEFYALVQQERLAMGGDAQRRFGKDSIRRGGMRAVMKKEANGRL